VLAGRGISGQVLDAIDQAAADKVDKATQEAKAGPPPRPERAGANLWSDGSSGWRN
jgi:hypothetical protein